MALYAFDTNILAYAAKIGESASDEGKVAIAEAAFAKALAERCLVLPIQVCLELHRLLVRKRRLSPEQAGQVLRFYIAGALLVASDTDTLTTALDLAARHRLQTYDAIILAAAASVGCDALYSEDMQHGFSWEGVTVINPFT